MSREKPKSDLLKQAVSKEVAFITNAHGTGANLAARYRHNVGKNPGDDPFLFGRLLEILPEELRGKGRNTDYAEEAAYSALTLFAYSKSNGTGSIADAISRVDGNAGLIQRFRLAEMAETIDEMRYRLRGVITLISSKGETFSYADLATDLYQWQFDHAAQIRRWERSLLER